VKAQHAANEGGCEKEWTMDGGLIGLVAVVLTCGIPLAVIYVFYRVRKLRTEERLAALARGAAIPMEPELSQYAKSRRAGILLVTGGLGHPAIGRRNRLLPGCGHDSPRPESLLKILLGNPSRGEVSVTLHPIGKPRFFLTPEGFPPTSGRPLLIYDEHTCFRWQSVGRECLVRVLESLGMHPAIPHLVDLQQLDQQIAALHAEFDSLPKRFREADAKLNGAKSAVTAAKEAHTQALTQRKKLELDVEEWKGRAKKYREQSSSVKTNESYKALLHEIANAEGEASKIEDLVLDQMMAIEEVERRVKHFEADLKETEN